MLSRGLLKRLLPFFASFALGLLIASFFVTVAAPSFSFGNRWKGQREYRGCSFNEREMRNEERRFRQRKSERRIRQNAEFNGDLNELVPPPPPLPPVAPSRVQ